MPTRNPETGNRSAVCFLAGYIVAAPEAGNQSQAGCNIRKPYNCASTSGDERIFCRRLSPWADPISNGLPWQQLLFQRAFPTPALPNKSGKVHKRHKRERQKAQKIVFFVFLIVLFVVLPLLLGTAPYSMTCVRSVLTLPKRRRERHLISE